MNHLEPLQETNSNLKDKRPGSSPPSAFKLFLMGTLLVAGLGYGMTSLWNAWFTDNISDVRKSELVAEFVNLKPVEVDRVAEQETDAALDAMRLSPDQRQQLKTRLSAQSNHISTAPKSLADESQLVWVTLWDFASADGDVVHVSSAGYQTDVTLQKQQTRIALPIGASKTIKITGVHDGGGGITLGVQSGTSPVSLPVLQPAQTLDLPVSY